VRCADKEISVNQLKFKMFTPVNMRSANAYRNVGVETAVTGADSHQLVAMLYEALLLSLGKAKFALQNQDIAGRGEAIGRAVRLIEEGLKAGLDEERGGELARNLRALYDYCTVRLTEANLRADMAALEEVEGLLRPMAEAWGQIRAEVVTTMGAAPRSGV
jgi:flagellar protein FliS